MPEDQPISWRTLRYGTPVVSSDDRPVGEVHEVLGSDADDIFHGLRVRLAAQGRDVMIPANDITGMSGEGVRTSLAAADIDGLGGYDEAATYHLASVGWLRTHLGWRRDSGSDEEPG